MSAYLQCIETSLFRYFSSVFIIFFYNTDNVFANSFPMPIYNNRFGNNLLAFLDNARDWCTNNLIFQYLIYQVKNNNMYLTYYKLAK